MSKYSEISKRIGWDRIDVAIPTPERAKKLFELVQNGDELAFETVFRVNRFGDPKNKEQIEAMDIINQAFLKGAEIFASL
jgi:hypothetical protein